MNIADRSVAPRTWNRPLSNPYTAKLTGGKGGGGWAAHGEMGLLIGWQDYLASKEIQAEVRVDW